MTHTLRVVCRPVVCDGFALAGVPSLPAVDGNEAAALLGRLALQPELGVVFVEEVLYRALPRELHDALERRALPVVVPFPGPRSGARPTAEAELVDLLREAIGYRVRLR